MAYAHEFGIIDHIEDYKEDQYEPEKYNCISVDGDLIDKIYNQGFKDKLDLLETFAHNRNRPYRGLAYYGITLIPQKSLKEFLDIIMEANMEYKSEDFENLIKKISIAIKKNKYVIHYGI